MKSPRNALAAVAVLLSACRQDMHNQPRYKPFAGTGFFGDGRSARPLPDGTVARGQLRFDSIEAVEFPFAITRSDLERGHERYNIFCSPCHSRLGDGQGIVVKRGFQHAGNFHEARLRNAAVGHFFDVITNGYGPMASYRSRIPAEDRWRIIAYIRALQLTTSASLNDVPPAERRQLLESK